MPRRREKNWRHSAWFAAIKIIIMTVALWLSIFVVVYAIFILE